MKQMSVRNLHIKLERYGDTGWAFTVTGTNPLTEETTTSRFRTNPAGDGLWRYVPTIGAQYPDGSPVMEYRQEQGTGQFWLPVEHRRAYDRLRREFGSI